MSQGFSWVNSDKPKDELSIIYNEENDRKIRVKVILAQKSISAFHKHAPVLLVQGKGKHSTGLALQGTDSLMKFFPKISLFFQKSETFQGQQTNK